MEVLEVTGRCRIPLRELRFRFSRSGGPGGQHVNRRDTRVELVFDLARSPSLGPRQRERAMAALASRLDSRGRLRVVASGERSQARNREIAVERFRELLAAALRERTPRLPSRRPAAAAERRLRAKRARSRLKRERAWRPDEG